MADERVHCWVGTLVDEMVVWMVVRMAEMTVDHLEPCSAANLAYTTAA